MYFKKHLQEHILFWVIIVVGLSSIFLFFSEISLNREAKIIFLDVGQGDAILIIAPNGRQVLIDSGKYSDISTKIAKYMPISDRSLDIIVATHPDIDHISGFNSILDEYSVDYFIHSGLLAGAPAYRSIANKVRNSNIIVKTAVSGEKIFLDNDMYLEILSPYLNQKIENPNDQSVVIKLIYGDTSVLLTGDASKLIERNLISMYGSFLDSDILKLGHHGSKTSSDNSFTEKVNPEYGIISAGCNNKYGHPNVEVLRVLDNNHIKELSTCDNGDIIFKYKDGVWFFDK